ncbi:hypothetical protein LCGC14_0612610 [marine sediment metagenome]|uniref:Uncharacterized protein n=1 Tax=marine sediment metagenome TaxID=412755 RepID=A0A0F9RRF6_9ZZZZ
MTKRKKTKLDKALEKGQGAKVKLYSDLLQMIAKGEKLSPTQLRAFSLLGRELEKMSGDSDPPELIASFDDAAEYCGVSKRTISHHLKMGHIRQNADGTFETSVLDDYLKSGRHRGKKGSATNEEQTTRAKLRKLLADARRSEIITKQLLGVLIHRNDVDTKWAQRTAALCSGLELLENRLPPLLEGKTKRKMSEIIKKEVWTLRSVYSGERVEDKKGRKVNKP